MHKWLATLCTNDSLHSTKQDTLNYLKRNAGKFAANLRSQHEIQNHNWTIHPAIFYFVQIHKYNNVV